MRNSKPTTEQPNGGVATTDHQRTYVADEGLHRALLASAGESVSLADGQQYVLRTKVGPAKLDRTLVTWYFDTDERDLYSNGAMLRWRGRQGPNGEQPNTGLIESRIIEADRVQRTAGAERAMQHCLEDFDDPAIAAVRHLTKNRQLTAVASQEKARRFLFAGTGALGSFRPETVIAIDQVNLHNLREPDRTSNRLEVEIQLFTKLPWLRNVDDARVVRFEAFATAMESKFSLELTTASSYQALPEELLT